MRPSGTPMLTPRMIGMRRSWAGCALSSSSSGTGAVAGESVDCGAVVMTEMLVMVVTWPSESEVTAVTVAVVVRVELLVLVE